ncbi:hypothetical protein RchiOBHm_Chr3g0483361 [Rosa chinensis]|uniref:Uncharacterized protein n=1 Tax=Rosa chinensis TaxID=74649 RepID=A0A2P6REF4_ROSCH|nr:hypothetical protein RchiOBHm_Chr3g0483361 [Rosa chinensis]
MMQLVIENCQIWAIDPYQGVDAQQSISTLSSDRTEAFLKQSNLKMSRPS